MKAQATGLPIMADNCGGCAMALDTGDSDILVNSEDIDAVATVIKKLFGEFDLWHKLRQQAIVYAQQYDRKAMADLLL